jgi:hypothetical protein
MARIEKKVGGGEALASASMCLGKGRYQMLRGGFLKKHRVRPKLEAFNVTAW